MKTVCVFIRLSKYERGAAHHIHIFGIVGDIPWMISFRHINADVDKFLPFWCNVEIAKELQAAIRPCTVSLYRRQRNKHNKNKTTMVHVTSEMKVTKECTGCIHRQRTTTKLNKYFILALSIRCANSTA